MFNFIHKIACAIVPVVILLTTCAKDKAPLYPTDKSGKIEWQSTSPITVYAPRNGGVWYPRLLELSDGTLLCAYDINEDVATTFIGLSRSTDAGRTWEKLAAVYTSQFAAANPHLIQMADGTILCAFREVESSSSFYIKLSKSTDAGRSWQLVSSVDHNAQGLWEPFLISKDDGSVKCFYSSESFQPDYSQVVAERTSRDLGKTWSEVKIVAKHSQSRDGMPTAVRVSAKVWLCFFEATDEANPFVIKSVRSSDGGQHWGDRRLVYQPGDPSRTASAPYGLLLQDGRLLCSFQSDEDRNEIGLDKVDMKVISSTDNGEHWKNKTVVYAGPFGVWWNSLIQLQNGTILAATSTNDEGRMKIKLIRGQIVE